MFRVIRQTSCAAVMSLAIAGCASGLQSPTSTPEVMPLYFVTDGATSPLLQELSAAYQVDNDLVAIVDQSRSGRRVQDLLDAPNSNALGYAITTRYPNDGRFWAAPLGYEAIAIITHPQLNINRLTAQDLRRIFAGNLNNWAALGYGDVPIAVITRDPATPVAITFDNMVMGERPLSLAALVAMTPTAMLRLVSQTPGAIGFIEFSLLDNRVEVVPIAEFESSPAITPDTYTISNGYYPLQSPVLIIGQQSPQPNDGYYEFILWAQQGEGRQIISNYYIPLSLEGDR